MTTGRPAPTTRPWLANIQISREDFNLARQIAADRLWNMKTTVGVAIRRFAEEQGLEASPKEPGPRASRPAARRRSKRQ